MQDTEAKHALNLIDLAYAELLRRLEESSNESGE